jgi:hypothetical protein
LDEPKDERGDGHGDVEGEHRSFAHPKRRFTGLLQGLPGKLDHENHQHVRRETPHMMRVWSFRRAFIETPTRIAAKITTLAIVKASFGIPASTGMAGA